MTWPHCTAHQLCEGPAPGHERCIYCAYESSPRQAELTARNPKELPDVRPKVENPQGFQEGERSSHSIHRQVGTPRGEDYDAERDFAGSIDVAYAEIRQRVAMGGAGWKGPQS